MADKKYGEWDDKGDGFSKPMWLCNCKYAKHMLYGIAHCRGCDTYRPVEKPKEPGNK